MFSSLQVGQEIEIPGDALKHAITALWAQDLFADIQIEVAEKVRIPVHQSCEILMQGRLESFTLCERLVEQFSQGQDADPSRTDDEAVVAAAEPSMISGSSRNPFNRLFGRKAS